MRQRDLLYVQLARETVGPVDHEPLGRAVIERPMQPWPVLDAQRARQRVVAEGQLPRGR